MFGLSLIAGIRSFARRTSLSKEEYSKLVFDILTIVPVVALLWNLIVYFGSNTHAIRVWFAVDSDPISFADAVGGVGEPSVLWACIASCVVLANGFYTQVTKP